MPSSREKIINELSAVSYVGVREASAALPAVESLGTKAVERYLVPGVKQRAGRPQSSEGFC